MFTMTNGLRTGRLQYIPAEEASASITLMFYGTHTCYSDFSTVFITLRVKEQTFSC